MANTEKPRAISLRDEAYDKLYAWASERGLSMRQVVEVWIHEKLDAEAFPISPGKQESVSVEASSIPSAAWRFSKTDQREQP